MLHNLGLAMRKTSAQGVLFSQAVADRVGMNPADVECLDILSESGPVTAGELAELTGLTTGAVTGLIDRLEKAGYVQRERDLSDRRRVIVQPLPKAQNDFLPLYEGLQQAIGRVCSSYSDEQLNLLLGFFSRLEPIFYQEIARLRGHDIAKEQVKDEAVGGSDLEAPLAATRGRLVLMSFILMVSLNADPSLPVLYRAHFEKPIPQVQAQSGEGSVVIRYPGFQFLDWLRNWGKQRGEITLNGSIPWSIEFRGPISQINADLSRLELNSIEFRSGVDELTLTLPRPVGSIPVRFADGINVVTIRRPANVALRVHIHKNTADLKIDQRSFEAVTKAMQWETPDYKAAANRYDIDILSNSSRVTIETY